MGLKRKITNIVLAGLAFLSMAADSNATEYIEKKVSNAGKREIIFNLGSTVNLSSGKLTDIDYGFPDGLGLTPPSRYDVESYPEPVITQNVEKPNGGVYEHVRMGVSVNPFNIKVLDTIRLGYIFNFGGGLVADSKSKPVLIRGTDPIDSFTYQKLSRVLSNWQEITAALMVPLYRAGDGEVGVNLGLGRSNGFRINAEQGWDTFGSDIKYRTITGKSEDFNRYHVGVYIFGKHIGGELSYESLETKVDWGDEFGGIKDFKARGINFDLLFR